MQCCCYCCCVRGTQLPPSNRQYELQFHIRAPRTHGGLDHLVPIWIDLQEDFEMIDWQTETAGLSTLESKRLSASTTTTQQQQQLQPQQTPKGPGRAKGQTAATGAAAPPPAVLDVSFRP